jgi:hypothetical protein
MSRVNYGAPDTIHHHTKVYDYGIVHEDHIRQHVQNWQRAS